MHNSKDLSLEIIIVGGRGSGKTLMETHFEIEYMSHAYVTKLFRELTGRPDAYPRRKVTIWSNYPVSTLWRPPYGGKLIRLEAEKLDIDKLVIWHPMYEDGVVFWDEIDQVADRQDWMATLSKMLTAGIQVMRHRNLSLIATIQSLNWLNARLQWQADIIIKCRDLAFSTWGREQGLAAGEVASATWIDKSGIMTGTPYEENLKTYPLLFFGKRYWNCYETRHEFDIMDLKRKYKIKGEVREIDLSERDADEESNIAVIHDTILQLVGEKKTEVYRQEFFQRARSIGFSGDERKIEGYLSDIGVTFGLRHSRRLLDISALVPDELMAEMQVDEGARDREIRRLRTQKPPLTLQAIGNKYGMTREAVRLICAKPH